MTVSSHPLGILLDRDSRQPVFEQICNAIRERVRSGGLRPGARLPATRALAGDLGVARSTVVTAYDQLVAEGYLSARQGSGFEVCALGEVELAQGVGALDVSEAAAGPELRARVRDPEEDVAPPRRPLEPGVPDLRVFPHQAWARTVARLCRQAPEALLDGGAGRGNGQLRRAIAAHLRDWRGIEAHPDQVLVTSGANEALDVCMRGLAQVGEAIGVEDPCYPPIRRFAEARGLRPVNLTMEAQGALPPEPSARCVMVVLTPSHQYPLGGAMSPARRQQFISWAQAAGAWIIEDDYDSEFRYAGRPIPAMAGFDRSGRTVYVGSFSKIFSNSLRVGYVVAPPHALPALQAALRRHRNGASAMPQRPLAEFILSGDFYRHLRRMRRIYAERHRALVQALRRDFAQWGRVEDHQAGMQMVFHLNEGVQDQRIAAAAEARGLGVEALSAYCVEAPGRNGLVLGACATDLTEQAEALALLREIFVAEGQSAT